MIGDLPQWNIQPIRTGDLFDMMLLTSSKEMALVEVYPRVRRAVMNVS